MSAPRLSDATLARLPAQVRQPDYRRQDTRIGIVHLGVGAFHRAHQAVYLDDLLAREPEWAICGVSLRSADVRDALAPQDGLYTLALLGPDIRYRVIGSLREVLCAPEQPAQVLARLADPAVRLVMLTVTEKGYCLSADGVDLAHPDIVADLAQPDTPASAIGYLAAGLRRRRAAGLPPYTVLSCDNLADNGGRLRRALLQYTRQFDPALAEWIATQGAFPRSMVDSITPATDAATRARVEHALGGIVDAWPVQREPYTQWVVEDWFCNGRPDLAGAGVILSGEIAGYDRAKLRLLNAPHSALAYLGSLKGIESVAEAMDDAALSRFIEQLMRVHIMPNVTAPAGFDANAYVAAILARFRNPAIRHRLAQIAWDGSQKIPVRVLATIADALAAGRRIDGLCLVVAAWLQFVRRQAGGGLALADPLDAELSAPGRVATGDARADIARFLALDSVFAPLSADTRFVAALAQAYALLGDGSATRVDEALLALA